MCCFVKEVGCVLMMIYVYFEGKIDILRYLWVDIFVDMFKEIEIMLYVVVGVRERL